MKFSAEWFKKLLRIGQRPDSAEDSEDMAGAGDMDKTAVVEPKSSDTDDTVVVATPGQESLANELSKEPEDAEPDATETGKQSLWTRWLRAFRKKPESDQTDNPVPDTDSAQKTGMWATMTAVIMRRSKKPAAEEAGDEEKIEPDGEAAEESTKPTWRQRLGAIFKRKAPAVDEESVGNSVKDSDLAEAAPDKKRKRAGDEKSGEVAVEEEQLNRRGRVAALLSKKIVWIPLLFAGIGLAAFAVTMLVLDMRKQEQAKVEALEKKYQSLQEENRKLQEKQAKPIPKPEVVQSQADKDRSVAKRKTTSGGNGDCTVSDKASVAEVLKQCIEEFNAADRRP